MKYSTLYTLTRQSNRPTGVLRAAAGTIWQQMCLGLDWVSLNICWCLTGDQSHMKESTLGSQLKGRAGGPRGGKARWQVACRPSSHTTQTLPKTPCVGSPHMQLWRGSSRWHSESGAWNRDVGMGARKWGHAQPAPNVATKSLIKPCYSNFAILFCSIKTCNTKQKCVKKFFCIWTKCQYLLFWTQKNWLHNLTHLLMWSNKRKAYPIFSYWGISVYPCDVTCQDSLLMLNCFLQCFLKWCPLWIIIHVIVTQFPSWLWLLAPVGCFHLHVYPTI